MEHLVQIVGVNAVEIVYTTFLAIQLVGTVIVDVLQGILMSFATEVCISAFKMKLNITHTQCETISFTSSLKQEK